jgi:hypothetical protein
VYDQSYSARNLERLLRRSDFKGVAPNQYDHFREQIVQAALQATSASLKGPNPIQKTRFKRKWVFRMQRLEDDLVVRKLTQNLRQFLPEAAAPQGREFIVSNLRHFLAEGVPYRVYRLDIRSFYESVPQKELATAFMDLNPLSVQSKQQLTNVLEQFAAIGGTGVPRGMAVSAVLCDLLMKGFDAVVMRKSNVYFYARYVDDIVIITNDSEDPKSFLSGLEGELPGDLKFNSSKCRTEVCAEKAKASDIPSSKFSFDYLGYEFSVSDPPKGGALDKYRRVRVDLARGKVDKIKTRVLKAFRAYKATGDVTLFMQRVRFLTSNFSLTELDSGKTKLAGIYYGYPQLTPDARGLRELDKYLRRLVLAPTGRSLSAAGATMTNKEKRALLSLTFSRGHAKRIFTRFTPSQIGAIQECWKHG